MYSVVLFREQGVRDGAVDELVSWFERFPGPVIVKPQRRPIQLAVGPDNVLLWDVVFETLRKLRQEHGIENGDFVFLLTASPNENNWYAAEDPASIRNAFGHTEDFSWVTTAPNGVVTAHYILKSIFNALLEEAGVEWQRLWHQRPRGCFFDFCADKRDLALKLRTADICGDCLQVFRSVNVPEPLLKQTVEIMEASRKLALGTGQYLPSECEFGEWPFPVAITRHKVVQASNPLFRFMLLLDHFDCIVRYFYLAHEVQAERVPEIGEKPALGWWVDRLANSLSGERHFREVVRIAERESVVHLRNERRGHGWMGVNEESYRQDAEHLELVLSAIEQELLPFFQRHRLVIPRQIRLRKGKYVVEGDALSGSHLIHPNFRREFDDDPRAVGIESEGDVYLADNRLESYKRISPFVLSATCPACQHPRILITDGTAEGVWQYIDVYMGHRVRL